MRWSRVNAIWFLDLLAPEAPSSCLDSEVTIRSATFSAYVHFHRKEQIVDAYVTASMYH